MFKKKLPKVSCCLVTYDRFNLFVKSVNCYLQQTYPNKEMVVVTEGPIKEQIANFVDKLERQDIKLVFLNGKRTLGEVRNISMDHASGELYCQWDDDDFNHPKRLSIQINKLLEENAFACFLTEQLHYYWQDNMLYWESWDYESGPARIRWIPGTIIMRLPNSYRYPESGPNSTCREDVVMIDQICNDMNIKDIRVTNLTGFGYLHVYSFHGSLNDHKNTFDKEHHMWLSRNRSFHRDTIMAYQEVLVKSLDALGLRKEIKVMGREGVAFVWEKGKLFDERK